MQSCIITFLFFVISSSVIWGQSSRLIQLPEYYKGSGVIIGDSSKIPIHTDFKSFFVVSIEEARLAETILQKDIKRFFKERYVIFPKEQSSSVSEKRKWEKTITRVNAAKRYKHYYRQYAGFINFNNEKIIFIGLLNFKHTRKSAKHFRNWENEIIVGFGEFYEKNSNMIFINIPSETIFDL